MKYQPIELDWRRLAFELWSQTVHWFCFALAAVSLAVFFPIRMTGYRRFPKNTGVLVLANHQSFLDPILLGLTLPRQASHVARSSLFRFAPFRWLIIALRAIKIDREGIGKEGLRACLERLKAGEIVVVFPEGKRTPDGAVGELKPGVLLLLERANTPIVLAGIAGAYESWPRSAPIPRPAPIWVCYQPWAQDPDASRDAKREALTSAMKDLQANAQSRRSRLLANRGPESLLAWIPQL